MPSSSYSLSLSSSGWSPCERQWHWFLHIWTLPGWPNADPGDEVEVEIEVWNYDWQLAMLMVMYLTSPNADPCDNNDDDCDDIDIRGANLVDVSV